MLTSLHLTQSAARLTRRRPKGRSLDTSLTRKPPHDRRKPHAARSEAQEPEQTHTVSHGHTRVDFLLSGGPPVQFWPGAPPFARQLPTNLQREERIQNQQGRQPSVTGLRFVGHQRQAVALCFRLHRNWGVVYWCQRPAACGILHAVLYSRSRDVVKQRLRETPNPP